MQPSQPKKPLKVRASSLDTARIFFEERGTFGYEGTAMLAGTEADGITRCVIPEQKASRGPYGNVYVEVTNAGKLTLASTLTLEERYLARIHSHPGEAFHSETDDRNPGLTAEGALSIVCPFFGLGLRRGIDACAVYVMHEGRWLEISTDTLDRFLEVIDV